MPQKLKPKPSSDGTILFIYPKLIGFFFMHNPLLFNRGFVANLVFEWQLIRQEAQMRAAGRHSDYFATFQLKSIQWC
jgi:hypothetical protein